MTNDFTEATEALKSASNRLDMLREFPSDYRYMLSQQENESYLELSKAVEEFYYDLDSFNEYINNPADPMESYSDYNGRED